MSSELQTRPDYQSLIGRISEVYNDGRFRAQQAVNTQLLATYWQIGHDIVEFEQGGQVRADYGSALLHHLSHDLTRLHGKGFSRSNLIYMRLLYLEYPISQKPSDLLSWSHYVELLRIDDRLERSFYEQQSIKEKWSVPELQRQKKSSLFLRLAAGKDKAQILQLANQGQTVEKPADLLRDPYVFEFLKIPEPHTLDETDLETHLCNHLQPFASSSFLLHTSSFLLFHLPPPVTRHAKAPLGPPTSPSALPSRLTKKSVKICVICG